MIYTSFYMYLDPPSHRCSLGDSRCQVYSFKIEHLLQGVVAKCSFIPGYLCNSDHPLSATCVHNLVPNWTGKWPCWTSSAKMKLSMEPTQSRLQPTQKRRFCRIRPWRDSFGMLLKCPGSHGEILEKQHAEKRAADACLKEENANDHKGTHRVIQAPGCEEYKTWMFDQRHHCVSLDRLTIGQCW